MYNERRNYQSVSDYINNEEYDEDEDGIQGESFDDFEFASIPENLQVRAYELYISEASMNDMYNAIVTYEDLAQLDKNHIPILNGDWPFPKSGTYKGVIIECERSKKNSFEFILKLLINGKDVKFIKFSPAKMSRVYRGICELIPQNENYFDVNTLIGCIAIVKIKNQRSYGGVVFSNVERFEILSETDEEIIFEMIKTMFEAYDEKCE